MDMMYFHKVNNKIVIFFLIPGIISADIRQSPTMRH